MNARRRTLLVLPLALFIALALHARPALASARSVDHGGSYFGSVIVEPGQVVEGDLNVVMGDATIEGTVDGDVNVVGGNILERPGASITGQTNVVGGDVMNAIVPWAPSQSMRNPFAPDERVMWRVAWDVVVLLVFLIFRLRTRMALDRLERHPGLTVGAGLIGWIAVIPLCGMLLISILLIPLIPVEAVALAAGVFVGKAALALLVGRRLSEMINPHGTPSPLGALVLGLVLLTAAELVPVIGILVTILVGVVSLGAVILSLFDEHHLTGGYVAGVPPRAPLSGPPMPVG